MRLRVITPLDTVLETEVARLVAEAPNGSFGMLPRHADFVSLLVPGILTYETEDGTEHYLGVNSGTLVKCGGEVLVSVLGAVQSDRLEELGGLVAREFRVQDEEEREARSALTRLEAGVLRRFSELGRKGE
jgi:F-type H+-transporting ATPase subunit epsilon